MRLYILITPFNKSSNFIFSAQDLQRLISNSPWEKNAISKAGVFTALNSEPQLAQETDYEHITLKKSHTSFMCNTCHKKPILKLERYPLNHLHVRLKTTKKPYRLIKALQITFQ